MFQHLFIHCGIHENYCNIHPVTLSIISCNIFSFILTVISHLSIQAEIFHSAREIVNKLIIANSKKIMIVININLLRNKESHWLQTSATKPLRLKYWKINQATPKCQIYFLGKTCKKGLK